MICAEHCYTIFTPFGYICEQKSEGCTIMSASRDGEPLFAKVLPDMQHFQSVCSDGKSFNYCFLGPPPSIPRQKN